MTLHTQTRIHTDSILWFCLMQTLISCELLRPHNFTRTCPILRPAFLTTGQCHLPTSTAHFNIQSVQLPGFTRTTWSRGCLLDMCKGWSWPFWSSPFTIYPYQMGAEPGRRGGRLRGCRLRLDAICEWDVSERAWWMCFSRWCLMWHNCLKKEKETEYTAPQWHEHNISQRLTSRRQRGGRALSFCL